MVVVVFIYIFYQTVKRSAETRVMSNNSLFSVSLPRKTRLLLTTEKNTIAVKFVVSVFKATKLKAS